MVTSVRQYNKPLGETIKTIPSTLTTLVDYVVASMKRVGINIANAGTLTDQFVLQAQFVEDGAWHTLFNTAGDFTSPAGILVGASGDLTAIADATSGWFILDTDGIFAIRLRAASSGADTVLTVNGGGS